MMKQNPQYQNFSFEKNTLIYYLNIDEYDFIEKIAKSEFSDTRCVTGVIKTYAIIRLFSKLNPAEQFVPIRAEVFRKSVSAKSYTKYIHTLEKHKIIEYKEEQLEKYTDIKGINKVICKSPMRYRLILMSYRYTKGIFYTVRPQKIPVRIDLEKQYLDAFRKKVNRIMEDYNPVTQEDKIDNVMTVPEEEVVVLTLVIKLIKDVYLEKVKSSVRFDRRIREISRHYKPYQNIPLNDKEYILSMLTYRVLINLYENKKKEKEIEHIVSNYLSNHIENQSFKWHKQRPSADSKFSYYGNLSVEVEALDYCIRMKDLYHIARINEIPKYNYPDKKLYSKLASIRKTLRRFVRYNDSRLVEVSDITSAHFTMLPLVFKKSGITISNAEMSRFKQTTQSRDLYGEVICNTRFTRDEIKPVFQPFFSIRNENSFLYNRPESDREKRKLICEYFKHSFPEIYQNLLSFHLTHSQTIKSVANEVESEIMNRICDTIRESGLHPFRVHDAVYLPDDECPLLQFSIKQVVYDIINEHQPSAIVSLPYKIVSNNRQFVNHS